MDRDSTYPCRWCGSDTQSLWLARGRLREYCSDACKQAAYRQRKHLEVAIAKRNNKCND